MDSHKVRMRPHSYALLCAVDDYIRKHDLRGEILSHAASDVLDGAVTRTEIDDLVRRRLLDIYRDGGGPPGDPENCGTGWTVGLTERAMRALWPDRAQP